VTGERSKAVSQTGQRYTCNIHPRSEYFRTLAANNFVPVTVVDLTHDTVPYRELRANSSVATGTDEPFLTAHREGSFHYPLIVAGYVGW
jgi:geranyl diphosphate 2-C-methyltransferase